MSVLAQAYETRSQHHRRAEASVRSGCLSYGATEHVCTVFNISPWGAWVRLAHPVEVWRTVTLYIDSVGALHCRVLWQRGDTIALQFVQDANWVNGKILAFPR